MKNDEFVPPGHYYSPIPDNKEIEAKKAAIFDKTIKDVPGIKLNDETQMIWFKHMLDLYKDIPFSDTKTASLRYYLDNPSYSYNDAIMLYTFVRTLQPKKIIEVGSGFSSGVMLDTIDLFLKKKTHVTFIEPFQDTLDQILLADDHKKNSFKKCFVQDVPTDLFKTLSANDILFIDSSHVSKVGSDVNFLYFEVLPRLNPGVYVHIHDVFFPFEYPEEWVLGEKRYWNEDYIVRAFLIFNDAYEIVFFNDYFSAKYKDIYSNASRCLKNTGGSLWLKKVK